MELGKDDDYYKQLQKDLANYCFKKEENVDREKTYLLRHGATRAARAAVREIPSGMGMARTCRATAAARADCKGCGARA